jgi:hypothetical protein
MRRRLIQLGLFLLLGAIVNVAVAWGCAALIDPNHVPMAIQRTFDGDTCVSTVRVQSRFGHCRLNRVRGDPFDDGYFHELVSSLKRTRKRYDQGRLEGTIGTVSHFCDHRGWVGAHFGRAPARYGRGRHRPGI